MGAAQARDLMQELNLMVSVEDRWAGDVITAAVSHLAARKPDFPRCLA